MIFLFVLPLLLILALLAAGYYFARVAVYPKVIPYQETYRREVEAGKVIPAEFDTWEKEEISIPSPYGYPLHGFYFPLDDSNTKCASRKTIVIVHGITLSLFNSVKYMPIFRKRGFNILIYDQRFHGRSGGPNCTFGFYEKFDLKTVVDWAVHQIGPDGIIGTHGESLGGATVLQHAGIDPRIAFVIADCPYSDLIPLFTYRVGKDYHLLTFPLLNIASQFSHYLTGMKFNDVRPTEDVRSSTVPILFCHGQQDDYIPPSMSVDLHHAKHQGIARLYLAPNARHAEAYWINQAEYEQKVEEFLAEVGV